MTKTGHKLQRCIQIGCNVIRGNSHLLIYRKQFTRRSICYILHNKLAIPSYPLYSHFYTVSQALALSTEYYSPSLPLAVTKISRAPQLKEIAIFWKLPKSTSNLLNIIATPQMYLQLQILRCWML